MIEEVFSKAKLIRIGGTGGTPARIVYPIKDIVAFGVTISASIDYITNVMFIGKDGL